MCSRENLLQIYYFYLMEQRKTRKNLVTEEILEILEFLLLS